MLVPEKLLDAVFDYASLSLLEEISAITIECNNADPEEVKSFLENEFTTRWDKKWRECIEWDEDDIAELEKINEYPSNLAYIKDGKVILSVEHPVVKNRFEEDEYCDMEFLEETLKATVAKFPNITMQGFVIVDYSDTHYGEVMMFEFAEDGSIVCDNEMVHDTLGLFLESIFSDIEEGLPFCFIEEFGGHTDEVWEYIESEADENDYHELQKCFNVYRNYLPESAFEALEEAMADME